MKKLTLISLILVLTPTFLLGQSWKKKTVMTIGDQAITAAEFMEVYEKNNVNGDVVEVKSIDEYYPIFVDFKTKVVEAEALKMDTIRKFQTELNGYRKQLAKPYLSSDFADTALLYEAFERLQYDLCASHILVKCGDYDAPADTLAAYNKAIAIRDRIVKGHEDFAKVAEETSDDPSARDHKLPNGQNRQGNRGFLGYFTAFNMVYPFENAAYNLKENEVSMPVRTEYGYHIIKLHKKTPALGTVQAAHIFFKVDDNDPDRCDSVVKAKAFNVYSQLTDKNWDELVKKYSDDKGTIEKSGKLQPFKVGSIVYEITDAIKGLKSNEVSKPIKTSYGYHIVKFIGNFPPNNLNDIKDKLIEKIKRDMRSLSSEENIIKRIKQEDNFKEYSKTKDNFISSIDSSLLKGKYVLPENVNTSKVLFKIGKKKVTIGDFAEYIRKKQRPQSFRTTISYAYEMYYDFEKKIILDYEDSILEEKYDEFRIVMREYHDGLLLFDLQEKNVWKKATEDTIALQNYYADHAQQYCWNERVEVVIGTATRSDNLDRLRELIRSNVSVDEMRQTIKNDSLRFLYVKHNYFQKGENEFVDLTPWVKDTIHEISNPKDRTTRIVHILDVRKPEPKSFKEAKGLVTADYQKVLEKKWMEAIRAKHPVVLNEKIFNKIKKYYEK